MTFSLTLAINQVGNVNQRYRSRAAHSRNSCSSDSMETSWSDSTRLHDALMDGVSQPLKNFYDTSGSKNKTLKQSKTKHNRTDVLKLMKTIRWLKPELSDNIDMTLKMNADVAMLMLQLFKGWTWRQLDKCVTKVNCIHQTRFLQRICSHLNYFCSSFYCYHILLFLIIKAKFDV